MIVELEVPVVAGRRHGVDDQRLVGGEAPVAVVIGDVRVAAEGGRERGIELLQRIFVLLKSFGPAGEERRHATHQAGGALQAHVERARRQRRRPRRPADAFDVQVGDGLPGAVAEGLAHDQGAGLGLHRQPIPRVRLAADQELERAVSLEP